MAGNKFRKSVPTDAIILALVASVNSAKKKHCWHSSLTYLRNQSWTAYPSYCIGKSKFMYATSIRPLPTFCRQSNKCGSTNTRLLFAGNSIAAGSHWTVFISCFIRLSIYECASENFRAANFQIVNCRWSISFPRYPLPSQFPSTLSPLRCGAPSMARSSVPLSNSNHPILGWCTPDPKFPTTSNQAFHNMAWRSSDFVIFVWNIRIFSRTSVPDPGGGFVRFGRTPLDPGLVAENARTGCIRAVH